MHWIIGVLDVSWTYIGCNLSPMTRYAPALGSHFYQTLSAAVVCPSLDISTTPTLGRIITGLSRPAIRPTWQLETEDWLSKAILAQNRGGQPATYESWLATAKWRAQDRLAWRKLVATATLSQTHSWRQPLLDSHHRGDMTDVCQATNIGWRFSNLAAKIGQQFGDQLQCRISTTVY